MALGGKPNKLINYKKKFLFFLKFKEKKRLKLKRLIIKKRLKVKKMNKVRQENKDNLNKKMEKKL